MTRQAIARYCAIPAAAFLVLIGILHVVVGLRGLRRAIERGEIAARFADSHLVNWAFSGATLSMLGLVVFLVLPGLRAGSRQSAAVAAAIGLFSAAIGGSGYLWVPTEPAVLVFLVFGALLAAPVLIWKGQFSKT